MANRRDLHIGITGDSAGLDAALQSAEDKARGLDRELEQLNRDMTAQERVAAATAVAVSRYGSENDKAALSARRLGTEAEQAATRAEAAVKRADAANRAYQRGLIDEEKAARASAAADRAIETAALKAAAANQAAAKATEERTRKEEQAARDADLAAAAEELAFLKVNGRVQQHDQLLGHLRSTYGDLSKTAVADFKELGTAGEEAGVDIAGMVKNFSILGLNGPVAVGAVLAAIQLLPFAATVAGDGVALGLGGALSLVAIKAQASSADVQSAFAGMKANVAGDLQQISQPFHATLLEVAADAQAAFKSLEPSLAAAFAAMAPAVTRFVRYFAGSLGELDPAIRSIGTAFTNVLDTLGPQMPTIIGNIGTGIKAITDAVASNPQALTSFVTFLSNVVRYTGDAIGFLIRYSSEITGVFKVVNEVVAGPLGMLAGAFLHIKGNSEAGGQALAKYENTLGALGTTSDATSQQLAHDMQVLGTATASAADKATALTDAFSKLLDPQQAVYADSLQLRTSLDALGTALAASGGKLDSTTQASTAAGTAFGGFLKTTQTAATDMLKAGASIGQVQQFMGPYVDAMYKAAGANQNARALVDGFVKSMGLLPPVVDKSGKVIAGFGYGLDSIHAPMTGAQIDAQKLGEDMDTLASHTATASDKANALNDAFTRLLDPELAAFQDTAKLRQGLDDLVAALGKSHGALNDNSTAARDAKDKFAALLKDVETTAGDMLKSGDSLDVVQRKLSGYIIDLYKAAGANKDARALVDAFARSIGLVPNSKRTVLYSNALAAKEQVDAYQRSINGLHGKTVTIDQILHQQVYTTQQLINRTSGPGYAHGGMVQHLADGGPSGLVSGPGSATSDSILTALSNGEFVVNAAATRQVRPLLEAINSGRFVAPVMSGASGGSAPGVDAATLARAVAAALHGTTVEMDSQPVGRIVSRTLGRQTDQRRRTG